MVGRGSVRAGAFRVALLYGVIPIVCRLGSMLKQRGSRHSRGEPGIPRLGRSLALPWASPM
jgi:hypothetical protein